MDPQIFLRTHIDKWYPSHGTRTLSLGALHPSITYIPYLPSDLEVLDCSKTQITSLPELPATLKKLICNDTPLTSLPPLPSTLVELHCCNTNITRLPELPTSLEVLMCAGTGIRKLPPLPTSLKNLNFNNTLVEWAPTVFPSNMTSLSFAFTKVRMLLSLPEGLTYLDCSNSLLQRLPRLPESLRFLYCSYTPIQKLPQRLPSKLYELECYATMISEFPVVMPANIRVKAYDIAPHFLPENIENVGVFSISEKNLAIPRPETEFLSTREYFRRVKEAEPRIRIIQRVKCIKERLIAATWHPYRVVDWCDSNAFTYEEQ